jgi:hypothetical protein
MKLKFLVLAGVLSVALGVITGCDTGSQPVEKPTAQQVDQMKSLREIFDKHNHDPSQFTPEEKKQFLDYEKGDQAKVDQLLAWMANPRGGGGGPQKPFATGAHGEVLPPGQPGN